MMNDLRCLFLMMLMVSYSAPGNITPAATPTPKPTTPAVTTIPKIAKQTTTESSADDEIEYSCFENKTISIHLDADKNKYNLFAVGAYTIEKSGKVMFGDPATNCSSTLSNVTETDINLENCTDNPVYVYFMTETHSQIFGGRNFHEYRLNCTLPNDGLRGSATLSVKPSNTADNFVDENKNFESVSLVMKLSKDTVKIADLITVTIKKIDSSGVPGFVLPTDCKATNNMTGSESKELLLLKDGKTADEDAITDFTVHDNMTASATLYAFRFINSDTVVLTCNATVCNTKWCNNDLNGVYATKSSRRRRSADMDEHGQEFQVSATLKIENQVAVTETSGQRSVHFNQLSGVIVLLAIVTTKMRLW